MMDNNNASEGNADGFPSSFPVDFVAYCKANFISADVFQNIPWEEIRSWRSVRIRDALPLENASSLSSELGSVPIPWLPCHAYRIPRSLVLSSIDSYKSGLLCCLDAASMATVVSLGVHAGDHVLDMCCCPGMKLTLLADALRAANHETRATLAKRDGEVVGVDIDLDRLLVARSVIRKHKVDDITSLILCDATTFDPADFALLSSSSQEASSSLQQRQQLLQKNVDKRISNLKKFSERQRKRQRSAEEDAAADVAQQTGGDVTFKEWVSVSHAAVASPVFSVDYKTDRETPLKTQKCVQSIFDKVLVDAECTHDGSVFHLDIPTAAKDEKHDGGISNSHRMARMNFDRSRSENDVMGGDANNDRLWDLQLGLLKRGFELVKPGGTLVYSTCSFSRRQNEDLVTWFIRDVFQCAVDTGVECRSLPPFRCDATVSPLLRVDGAMLQALENIVDVETTTVVVDEKKDCSIGDELRKVDLFTARFWPHKSKTSFQFLAAFQKVIRQ